MKTIGFIIDLDGTLLDSMVLWENLGYNYLKSKGITDIPQELNEILKPLSLMQGAEYFIKAFGIKLTPEKIIEEINKSIESGYKNEVGLKEGAVEFLNKFQGVKMCIATAAERDLAQCALKRLGIDDFFDFIITSTEVGGSKLTPEIYISAAKRLGLAVSDVIVFEDALHAVKAAKSAGFYTVGVFDGRNRDDKDDIIHIADEFVFSLNEFEVS